MRRLNLNFEIPEETLSGAPSPCNLILFPDGLLPFGVVDPFSGFRGRFAPPGCIVDEPEAGRKAAIFQADSGGEDRIRKG